MTTNYKELYELAIQELNCAGHKCPYDIHTGYLGENKAIDSALGCMDSMYKDECSERNDCWDKYLRWMSNK